jgi:lipoyl(octanoyl) transferase
VNARFVRLEGLSDYRQVHRMQQRLIQERLDGGPDVVLLLEHAPVITVGRKRGAKANVLAAGKVPVVEVERGGDVTWHGPGQLVAYPIVKLDGKRRDLHRFLHGLEDAVIEVLTHLGLAPLRDARNTGVWLPSPTGPPRKVCSVGIACRKWVTWHGLALNVTPDLQSFAQINPCGFSADVMTRIIDHQATAPALEDLVQPLARSLAHSLGLEFNGRVDRGTP